MIRGGKVKRERDWVTERKREKKIEWETETGREWWGLERGYAADLKWFHFWLNITVRKNLLSNNIALLAHISECKQAICRLCLGPFINLYSHVPHFPPRYTCILHLSSNFKAKLSISKLSNSYSYPQLTIRIESEKNMASNVNKAHRYVFERRSSLQFKVIRKTNSANL